MNHKEQLFELANQVVNPYRASDFVDALGFDDEAQWARALARYEALDENRRRAVAIGVGADGGRYGAWELHSEIRHEEKKA